MERFIRSIRGVLGRLKNPNHSDNKYNLYLSFVLKKRRPGTGSRTMSDERFQFLLLYLCLFYYWGNNRVTKIEKSKVYQKKQKEGKLSTGRHFRQK